MRLASFNVENLFARAKALDTTTWAEGEPALAAFDRFNTVAARAEYTDQDKADMLAELLTLRSWCRPRPALRLNPNPFGPGRCCGRTAATSSSHRTTRSRGSSPTGRARLVGLGRADHRTGRRGRHPDDREGDHRGRRRRALPGRGREPPRARPSSTPRLLGNRYAHGMLIDGNDPRGIDVGLYCARRHRHRLDAQPRRRPRPARRPGKSLFSRDCPVYRLRLPGGADLYLLLNHFKSQSFSSGNPDPLAVPAVRPGARDLRPAARRRRQPRRDPRRLQQGPGHRDPSHHPTLEPLLDPGTPLVDAYDLPGFDVGPRPGSFQSCSLRNRLDYILLSPDLAATATGGGVFRKGCGAPRRTRTNRRTGRSFRRSPRPGTPRPTTRRSSSTSTFRAGVCPNSNSAAKS